MVAPPGPDGGASLDNRFLNLPVGLGLQTSGGGSGARVRIVDEHYAWPMKTLSSRMTPSQINVWLEILHRFPTVVFLNLNESARFSSRHQSRIRRG